ncbi:NRDE-2, necessary for RNA interference-domain-containing protein [Lipomyces orientalis]|uniref:NRDE-2, necessary for RNA interference-domain-containing protein n=1 Tax=Lipomyces orientalis TaxID=1233043 RepID=A0ACC3TCB7_9ASCO
MSDQESAKRSKAVPKFSSFNPSLLTKTPAPDKKSQSRRTSPSGDSEPDIRSSHPRHRAEDLRNRSSRHKDRSRRHGSHNDNYKEDPHRLYKSRGIQEDETGKWSKSRQNPTRSLNELAHALTDTSRAKSVSSVKTQKSTNIPHDMMSSGQLYVVDTKRDIDNLTYGKPSKYSVPKYYRVGRGRVLGLGPEFRLEQSMEGYSGPAVIVRDSGRDSETKTRGTWVLSSRTKRLRVDTEDGESRGLLGNFVPLSSRYNPDDKTADDDRIDVFSDENKSIEWDITSGEGESYDFHGAASKKIMELSKAVDEFPKSASRWHDLANAMAASAPSGSPVRVQWEVSFSVYQKAVDANPGETSLTLKYMDLYENLSGKYQAAKKWLELISKYPKNLEFWIGWMEFNIRDSSTFEYQSVLAKLIDVIARIAGAAEKESEVEKHLVYVMVRACRFMYESGYTEHAIAVIQGLVEINYLCPDASADPSVRVQWLRTFWAKETPRIGEIVGQQWQSTYTTTESHRTVNGSENTVKSSWIKKEVEASKYLLPSRTDQDEDDPFRVILFTDIAPFMYVFHTVTARTDLVWASLKFLGCDIAKWNGNSYLDSWPVKFAIEETATGNDPFEHVIDIEFTDRVIKSLQTIVDEEDLLVWFLEWDFRRNGSTSLKSARSLLKRKRDGIKLWRQYSSIEWRLGHKEKANSVYVTAVEVLKDDDRCILLWERWAELAFFEEQEDVFTILLGIPEGRKLDEISNTAVLKARAVLTGMVRRFLGRGQPDLASNAMKCFTLLEYLSSDRDIDGAAKTFTTFIDELALRYADESEVRESCSLFMAKMIRFHMSKSPFYKVATLRVHLESCIAAFPHNMEFISMYTLNERKYRIDNNVNNLLNNVLLNEDVVTIPLWRFAIWYQLERGAVHVARAFFERAVTTKRTQNNIDLWRAYVMFEMHQGMRLNAKKVLFRAIAMCPWGRDLLLAAFDGVREVMNDSELRQVCDILMERQLRLRVEIPENEFGHLDVVQAASIDLPLDADSDDESDDRRKRV